MALLGNLFRGRGGKKQPEKQPAAPVPAAAPPPPKAPSVPASSTTAAGMQRPPGAQPPKAMELDAIVSALRQIEEVMGVGGGGGAKSDTLSADLYSVSLKLGDLVKIMPSAFRPLSSDAPVDEICEVLVERLFDQLAKGKVVTKMKYFVAGVPPHYVAPDVEERGETPVNLPLAMVVASIDPDELKKRTSSIEKANQAKDLPNLFGTGAAPKGAIAVPATGVPKHVPAPKAAAPVAPPAAPKSAEPVKAAPVAAKPPEMPKPAAAAPKAPEPAKPVPVAKAAEPVKPAPVAKAAEPVKPVEVPKAPAPAPAVARPPAEDLPKSSIRLSEMAKLLPNAFAKSAGAADAKVPVLIEGLFDQLAKGKVQTTVARFLAHVPTEYLAAGVDLASKEVVALPLALVVDGVASDELVKRTTSKSRELPLRELPNLFVRGDGKPAEKAEAKAPPAAAQPVAPAAAPQPAKPELRMAKPAEAKQAAPPAAPEPPKPGLRMAKPVERKPAVPFQAPVPKADAAAEEGLRPPEPIKAAALPPKPVEPAPKPVEPKPVAAQPPVVPAAPEEEPEPPAMPIEPPKKIAIPLFMEEAPAAAEVPKATPVQAKPVEKAVPPALPVAEKPAATPAVVESGTAEALPSLIMRGVDLNTASVDELCRIDGVGQKLAEKIVQERTSGGPFFGFYDLARVAGIGRKAFEKITGLPWREEQYGQLDLVNRMLEHKGGGLPDLKEVAGRFKELPGIEGCAILHRDGHLLATSWEAKPSEALQARAPQIFKRVAYYMRHISPEETMGVTVSTPDRALTFAQSQDICFIAIHSPKGITRRHMQIVQGVCLALGHRFSGVK